MFRLTAALSRRFRPIGDRRGRGWWDDVRPRVDRNLDVSATVEERPIGGLGLLLVRRVTEGLVTGLERFFRSAERRQPERGKEVQMNWLRKFR